jgi:hypothetical protein
MDETTGKAKGGVARMAALTPEQRREMGRKAAAVRWAAAELPVVGGLPEAKFGAPNKPLKLGQVEIPCYVLDDGRRVLVQRGLLVVWYVRKGRKTQRKIVTLLAGLAEKVLTSGPDRARLD